MRLAVLVSGRGSNLAAVLEAISDRRLRSVEAVLVISNRPAVAALDVAARHGVPALTLRRADFPTPEERDRAIGQAVTDAAADLVLLAGYDQLLGPAYFEAYGGRTLNIHPSLLPAHGGPGMLGMAVHAAVLAAGDSQTGVSIHEVTPELDGGPVVAQRAVPVLEWDTPERLAERVLAEEHRCVVETLAGLTERA